MIVKLQCEGCFQEFATGPLCNTTFEFFVRIAAEHTAKHQAEGPPPPQPQISPEEIDRLSRGDDRAR